MSTLASSFADVVSTAYFSLLSCREQNASLTSNETTKSYSHYPFSTIAAFTQGIFVFPFPLSSEVQRNHRRPCNQDQSGCKDNIFSLEKHLVERKLVYISPLETGSAQNWKCFKHSFLPICEVFNSSLQPCCWFGIKSLELLYSTFKHINVASFMPQFYSLHPIILCPELKLTSFSDITDFASFPTYQKYI